jgi:hypothetical protein
MERRRAAAVNALWLKIAISCENRYRYHMTRSPVDTLCEVCVHFCEQLNME